MTGKQIIERLKTDLDFERSKRKSLQAELQAKEQECEHWKHQAELGVDTTDRLTKEVEAKEQECEELKNKLAKSFADERKKEIIIDQLKANEETYKYQWEKQYELCEYWQGQAEKYKQTLQEIKEIAESVTGIGLKCENCQTDGYCADCEDEILKQILQKCEVIDEHKI